MPENTNTQVAQTTNGLQMILSKEPNEITKRFIESMFASYYDREQKRNVEAPFKPDTLITLTPSMYKYVKEPTKTTLALLTFNRYVLERPGIIQHVGYWNETLTKKKQGQLSTMINNLFIQDIITAEQLGQYIDSRDELAFWLTSFMGASVTPSLILPIPNLKERKKQLFKQYEADLKSDNPITRLAASNKIEKELIDMANNHIKSDSGYDMYASGVNDVGANYKNINVMLGAVYNNLTNNFDVSGNSLMDGVDQYDMPIQANSIVAGAYPSAVGTAEAGAMAKIILATLQSVEIDPDPQSDCGTKSTIPFTITDDNKQYVLFRNIIGPDGKRVMLTLDNINKYVNTTIRMYSPQCCLHDKICCKCGGKVFMNLGVTKIGLLTTEITQKLLNYKLKSKHDISQKASEIPLKYIMLDHLDMIKIENGNIVNKHKMRIFIPKLMESQSVFEIESSTVTCLGVAPVKFYDNQDKEIASTTLTIPSIMAFHVYSDIQEDMDNYILTYESNSIVTNVAIRESLANIEYYLNQVYLLNKQAIVPYEYLADLMFKCLTLNHKDLDGPSITYECLARELCRNPENENEPFAYVYGKNPKVNTKSYKKIWYREAVQRSGFTQSIVFQDISTGMNRGLAMTLNGEKTKDTPIDKIIRA